MEEGNGECEGNSDRGSRAGKGGCGVGLVLVKLVGVRKAGGSCKSSNGDPEGLLLVENQLVVGSEVSGSVRRREGTKLVACVGDGGDILLNARDNVGVNR